MSDGLRRRLRGEGVYVGLIKPGNIATDMNPRFPETDVRVVTKAMEEAVVSPYPKPRYYPGIFIGRPCWLVCKLFAVLPERLADKLFKLG
mmetsp:Transcript_105202/g.303446  ORF Transcript_105202/g.303446 Transcript_105202/m.303446 type:complete len:90 (-) Transcript_105202:123-392(-)